MQVLKLVVLLVTSVMPAFVVAVVLASLSASVLVS
jgi:hypothetical protein